MEILHCSLVAVNKIKSISYKKLVYGAPGLIKCVLTKVSNKGI